MSEHVDNTPSDRPTAGLCADCLHVRRIDSANGSRFYLCERSFSDARFVRYPRVPVLHCPGYERAEPRATPE
jgi:hypothetical protein